MPARMGGGREGAEGSEGEGREVMGSFLLCTVLGNTLILAWGDHHNHKITIDR